MSEKVRASSSAGPKNVLGKGQSTGSNSRNHGQRKRTTIAEAMWALIDAPAILVDEIVGTKTVVWIASLERLYGQPEPVLGPPPRGWSTDLNQTFCHHGVARSCAAWAYAHKLRDSIRLKAVDELERRHRRQASKERDRDGRS